MSSLPGQIDFAKTEEEICERWQKEDTFQTQNRLSLERGDEKFTFYDGPPFATGLPHYGHILAGTIKDTVTRYAAMSQKYVERRAGWDCHGLPVEYEIDQMLGITHREQVLEMGIAKYNDTCRSIVTRYTSEWEATVNRLGRWIDFRNDYKTMDVNFMESVWWVFGQLFEKDLVYQGYKVMPYSTGCKTPLSNFEAGLNYKDVQDPAVVVSFPLIDEPNVYLVAWTTTPWTLPSNLALCVHPELEYVQIKDTKTGQQFILAKSRLPQLYPEMNSKKWKPEKAADYFIIEKTLKGDDLKGRLYKPLFDYFPSPNHFRILTDTYVTDDAGTGIVHQAPAFGEDDYRVCLAHNVIEKGQDIPCPVDADGNLTIDPFKGVHVKAADEKIIALLKENGRLVKKDVLLHSYPFCWRSDTPLIYKAVPSWFVKVEQIRDRVVANNKQTHWVPNEIKEGRFHNWLVDARDWAVSRNRFWGTPIPIWADEKLGELVCISSIAQLEELGGRKVTDLHRENIDDIEIPSKKNPGTMLRRVDEVFDCWFESGSMPYAQSHYPFENKEEWEKGFPADFIAEGLDQTRGWFYTLMVLSTALFDRPAFQNNIVNGMVLAADGQKMSKRKKNYPDPNVVIQKYGADALRMYLVNSPVVKAEPLKFREEGVLGVVKEVFLPLYNAFRFFLQNVERCESKSETKFVPDLDKARSTQNPTDIWIAAEAQGLIKFVHQEMQAYRLYTVMPSLVQFGTHLTNWYVRLNRERLKGNDGDDSEIALQVLYNVLMDVTVIMAPFTPFITEFFYQHLRKFEPSFAEAATCGSSNPPVAGKSDSVHFLKLPAYDATRLNPDALESMLVLQGIVEQGRNAREKRNISLKFPVKSIVVVLRNPSVSVIEAITGPLKKYILSELNAWDFQVVKKEEEQDWITVSLKPNFAVLGKRLGKRVKEIQNHITSLSHAQAVKCLEEGRLVIGVDDVVLDATTELEAKMEFSRSDQENWEATSKSDGSLVVAVDCTQDDETRAAGMAREVINGIQQLRKSAGLDISDLMEVFFEEEPGCTVVEEAIGRNVDLFRSKFKGSVPLPRKFAPKWSVKIEEDSLMIGETKVSLILCRPAIAARSGIDATVENALATLSSDNVLDGKDIVIQIDGKDFNLTPGKDIWISTMDKVKSEQLISWIK